MEKQFKFEISSLNSEKCINKITEKYEIYNFSKSEEKVVFYCKNKDKKNIEKILKNINQKIYSKKYYGIFYHIKNFTKIGIITGIIFSIFLWFLSTFFVTNILIYGNISFTESEVINVFEKYNIKKWTKKSNIDLNKLKTELEEINYISYASLSIHGNTLLINIKEQLTNNEIVNLGNFQPLVSLYDGIITSAKLIQGTLNVKVGDVVKVGDILVYPYTQTADNQTKSVQPLADISCDVFVSSTYSVKEKQIKKVRTGESMTNYEISLCGLVLYSKTQNVNFLDYEKEEKENFVTNSILPIKQKVITYYELTQIEENVNFEQNKQIFIDKSRQIALLNLGKYDIIKNESYSIQKNEDTYTIFYNITFNKKIL